MKQLDPWARRAFTRDEVLRIRKSLVAYAAGDLASDYMTAEQVVLGAESLTIALDDGDRVKAGLDALFKTLDSDANFSPGRFADVARSVQGRF